MKVETTSYDTISNAYFALLYHTDVIRWKRLLVVTNAFHMPRSKVIFDWVFCLSSSASTTTGGDGGKNNYHVFYLDCPNTGMTKEVVEARTAHEKRGENNLQKHLIQRIRTLPQLWHFALGRGRIEECG